MNDIAVPLWSSTLLEMTRIPSANDRERELAQEVACSDAPDPVERERHGPPLHISRESQQLVPKNLSVPAEAGKKCYLSGQSTGQVPWGLLLPQTIPQAVFCLLVAGKSQPWLRLRFSGGNAAPPRPLLPELRNTGLQP